ncbi:hypothetical protein ACTFIW_008711 [Dictyostelium discoideum]
MLEIFPWQLQWCCNGKYYFTFTKTKYRRVKKIIPYHYKQVAQSKDSPFDLVDKPITNTNVGLISLFNLGSLSFSLTLDDSITKSCFTVSGSLDNQSQSLSLFSIIVQLLNWILLIMDFPAFKQVLEIGNWKL